MFKRLSRVILMPALLISAGLAVSTVWSKPPDLPIDTKETCVPPCSPAPGGATLFGPFKAPPEVTANSNYNEYAAWRFYEIGKECEEKGDAAMARNCYEEATRMCPDSKYGQLASQRLGKVIATAGTNNPTVPGGFETEEEPPQVKQEVVHEERIEPRRILQSQRMLLMGQRYQRVGDLDNAYRCFEDAHLICPACRYGQNALDRMRQIEATKSREQQREGGLEEQEPPVDRRPPLTPEELDQRDQAEVLFQLGERCRRGGDLRTAYVLYQETHLVFPESYFGMKAIDRLHEIETRRAQPSSRDERQGVNGGYNAPKPQRLQTLLWLEEGW